MDPFSGSRWHDEAAGCLVGYQVLGFVSTRLENRFSRVRSRRESLLYVCSDRGLGRRV